MKPHKSGCISLKKNNVLLINKGLYETETEKSPIPHRHSPGSRAEIAKHRSDQRLCGFMSLPQSGNLVATGPLSHISIRC